MFHVEEIIFAPTSHCSLACAHCRVSRTYTGTLEAGAAVKLLQSAAAAGVERVGFSGGEPFLAPEFLETVCAAAVENNLMFGRLMTNGLWWKDEQDLRNTLNRIADAGFDGTIGLSADAWHGGSAEQYAVFLQAVFAAFDRRDCTDITGVLGPKDTDEKAFSLPELYKDIAAALGGVLTRGRTSAEWLITGGRESMRSGGPLWVPLHITPYSHGAQENAWGAEEWFTDDYCAGPGNVLFVHPDGRVAPCCGYANERDELILGSIYEDGFDTMVTRARSLPLPMAAFETGLGAYRETLSKEGVVFPGKTGDICFFCDWLCEKGLVK